MKRPSDLIRLGAVICLVLASAPLLRSGWSQDSAPSQAWGPYYKDDKGEKEWPQKPKDHEWMFVAFRDYVGEKPTIAALVAGNQPGGTAWEWSDGVNTYKIPVDPYDSSLGAPVEGIEELVTAALMNTHRFTVVDRMAMSDIKKEQDLGTEGTSTPQSAPALGRVLGAQYLIKATVNEWKADASKSHGVFGGITGKIPGAGGIGGGKSKAKVAMSFKLVDAATSEVIDSRQVEAETSSWEITPGGIAWTQNSVLGGIGHLEKNSPATYAVVSCVNKAVYAMTASLKPRPWSGIVLDATEGQSQVIVNGGAGAGLSVGMKLTVSSKGREITDPSTGKTIRIEGDDLGTITITKVKPDHAFAQTDPGCQALHRGDNVKKSESAQQ